MKQTIRYILAIMAAVLAFAAPARAAAPDVTVKMSLDSAWLLMGKVTPLHIEVAGAVADDAQLLVPQDSMCGNVEIHSIIRSDTTQLGNGRRQINVDMYIQSFDSGAYMLNPVLYVAGGETIKSNRPVLKVLTCDVDSLETIHDYADVADVHRRFADYLPDWLVDNWAWLLAALILIAAGLYIWYYLTHRSKAVAVKAVKPVPPYDKAITELDRLRSEQLCQRGLEKEFYTRLTEILRQYLQGRFGINAMEMTSSQILAALRSNPDTRLSKDKMQRVLEIADFVKFAKVRPMPEDNTAAFNSATAFVEETKPLPPAPEKEDTPESQPTKSDR